MGVGETVVTVTDRAACRLRDIMSTKNRQACGLRIALVRTHCMGGRGFTYQLGLEDSPSRDDGLFEHNGVAMYVDPESSRYLGGAELDYVDGLGGSGFTLNNPNVIAKCPCGHHDIFD